MLKTLKMKRKIRSSFYIKRYAVLACILFSIILFHLTGVAQTSESNLSDDFDFIGLLEHHGSIMLILQAETGKIVYANQAAVDFYGYSRDVLYGMKIHQINTLTSAEVEIERQAAIVEARNNFVFKHRLASGEIRTVEVSSYPYQLEGQLLLFSVIQDITVRDALLRRQRTTNTIIVGLLLGLVALLVFSSVRIRNALRSEKAARMHADEAARRSTLLFETVNKEWSACFANEEVMVEKLMELTRSQCGAVQRYDLLPEQPPVVVSGPSGATLQKQDIVREMCRLVKENAVLIQNESSETLPDRKTSMPRHMIVPVRLDEEIVAVACLSGKQEQYDEEDMQHVTLLMEGIWNRQMLMDTQQTLALGKERYQAVLLSIREGVIFCDSDDRIVLLNGAAETLTGLRQAEAQGCSVADILKIQPFVDDNKRETQHLFGILGAMESRSLWVLTSSSGVNSLVDYSCVPVDLGKGMVDGSVIILHDRTKLLAQQEHIDFLNRHDQLTRLYNRRYIEVLLRLMEKNVVGPFAMIMADIDGLKLINDAYGNETGDQLLVSAGKIHSRFSSL